MRPTPQPPPILRDRLIQLLEAETRDNAPTAACNFMAEIRAAMDNPSKE